MAYSNGPKIVTDGLVLCLDAANRKSYPGSGTSWTDISGNGNNGTLVNGPTFNSESQGNIIIDGTNDRISINPTSNFAFGTGDFAFEMMVKDYDIGYNYQHFFAINDQYYFTFKGFDDGTRIQIYAGSSGFTTFGAGGIPNANANEWVLEYGQWTHIVLVRSNGIAYGYKNGQLKGSKSGWTTNLNVSAYYTYIGWGWNIEYRQQAVGVARIYNRSLSANEVQQNYNALKGRYGLT
jgi:hypothetical protein